MKTKPKVAVLGKTRSILTWFDDLQDGFRQVGAEVAGMGIQPVTAEERMLQKTKGLKELENPKVRARIRGELEAFQPDLVVVQNKAGLPAKALEDWSTVLEGVPTAGWLCDCIGGPPTWLEPSCDLVYYFDSACQPHLEVFYGKSDSLHFLPLAVSVDRYRYAQEPTRKPAMVFAGKCSDSRKKVFAEIRATGIPLEIFGPGCGDWLRPWRGRRISSDGLAKLYRSYVASLNIPQPGNTEEGLNLRAFESPCCGGVGLYPMVPDLPRCFEPGKEILTYESIEDLAKLMKELLADPERADAVALAGRQRVLDEHQFIHRAKRMLVDFNLA